MSVQLCEGLWIVPERAYRRGAQGDDAFPRQYLPMSLEIRNQMRRRATRSSCALKTVGGKCAGIGA